MVSTHSCLLVATTGVGACSVLAQSTPQITQPVDPSVRHVFKNSVPAPVHGSIERGRAAGSMQMRDVLLRVKPTAAQQAALAAYLEDVENADSPNYHHWLTPAEFASRFSASDADLRKVKDWLISNGLEVGEVAEGKRWIRFSGTAAQVEHAFGTEIHNYTQSGKNHFANATPLSVPDALAGVTSGPVSLNSFEKPAQHSRLRSVVRDETGKLASVPAADPTPQGTQWYARPTAAWLRHRTSPARVLLSGYFSLRETSRRSTTPLRC